jgi:hypothetical protein
MLRANGQVLDLVSPYNLFVLSLSTHEQGFTQSTVRDDNSAFRSFRAERELFSPVRMRATSN